VCVSAVAIGLPDFDQGVRQRGAFAVKYSAYNADVGAGHTCVCDCVAEYLTKAKWGGRQAHVKKRANSL
jgi:hypothetical protein